ncbi:acyltransferase [Flavihumibacter sediminis]|nr:acyltransferase [Flavihumibacter sediminis]
MIEKLKYILRNPFRIIILLIIKLPYFRFLHHTKDYQNRVSFDFWFKQKILNFGGNRKAYWPVHWTSQVYDVEKIIVGIDAYPGIMKGCYIQGRGGIEIGDFTQIAPNVIIVSANHDIYDTRKHIESKVTIGKYCWIGAGAKIMPGVILGDWTIVGAGAVVTRSFPEGYSLIAGVPAVKIKDLDKDKCIPYSVEQQYIGYIQASKFKEYRRKNLIV